MAVHSRFTARLESRFGIAFRLASAFGAVAILAVAANLIAEHGPSVIRTSEIRVVTVPAFEPPVTATTPARRPVVVETQALHAAITRFGRAVHSRAADAGPQRVLEERQAAAALEQESAAFFAAAAREDVQGPLVELRAGLRVHGEAAASLLRQADEGRRLRDGYLGSFEALDTQVKTTLDRAWKILGRVIARQSLVDLGRTLDQMRPHLALLLSPDLDDGIPLDALAAGEAAIDAVLQRNRTGLARSQGQAWLAAMESDLAALAANRQALELNLQEGRAAIRRFDAEGKRLAGMLRQLKSAPVVPAALDPALATAWRGGGPSTRRLTPASQSTTEGVVDSSGRDERLVVAWLSAGVLLLLLGISITTSLSIVRPVTSLMAATRKIANGERGVTVPRGGIKELDALAAAFNTMADRLAAAQDLAREYHGQLEARVEERTRQLQHLAEHDPLTQLPNRRQFFAQLNTLLKRAERESFLVGVYFLDLDNFKNINDSMGHVFGDRVLQALAQRLREVCAPFGFAARLGGDEFTVVLARATSVDDVVAAGWSLVRAFQRPLEIDGRELTISVSAGASVYPDHELEVEGLLRAADAALFRAKAQGRSQLSVFSADLLEIAASKFTTEQGMRRAIERGEFELFFQPEVNAETGRVDLVEALIRWRLPNGKYVLPDHFLAIAEESGLISQISEWVVRSAVEAAARWHHAGWPDVRVAINVSSRQLLDADVVEKILAILREQALPPGCIEFELTENVLQTGSSTIEALRGLRTAGFGVALDDFGTGYSSLVSLEQLPLTRVKLDRALIASVDTSPRSLAIARAIVGLCQGLGLEITAEGVERREQLLPFLNHRGMYVQGYLVSRPLPASEVLSARAEIPARWASLLRAPAASRPMLAGVR